MPTTTTHTDTEQTGADSPEIGVTLDETTHYAHTRYAASDAAGVVWYDPRDGREYYTTGASGDDLTAVGDETLTSVVVTPYQPSAFGDPAARYLVKRQFARLERHNEDREHYDTYESVGHYVRSQVFEGIEAAREWCRVNVDGYAGAPRRDAVCSRAGVETSTGTQQE